MKVKIRTKDVHFSMPVPIGMATVVIRAMPDRIFAKMREEIPEPYDLLMTKEVFAQICGACMDVLKENKGLEIVHVEAADGTFVSIRL